MVVGDVEIQGDWSCFCKYKRERLGRFVLITYFEHESEGLGLRGN